MTKTTQFDISPALRTIQTNKMTKMTLSDVKPPFLTPSNSQTDKDDTAAAKTTKTTLPDTPNSQTDKDDTVSLTSNLHS